LDVTHRNKSDEAQTLRISPIGMYGILSKFLYNMATFGFFLYIKLLGFDSNFVKSRGYIGQLLV